MSQRRHLRDNREFGNGPISQSRIDRHVLKTDGTIPRRTSEPPVPAPRGLVNPLDEVEGELNDGPQTRRL